MKLTSWSITMGRCTIIYAASISYWSTMVHQRYHRSVVDCTRFTVPTPINDNWFPHPLTAAQRLLALLASARKD